MLVDSVMTAPVVSAGSDMSIQDAARLMLARRISGLPVVSQDGKLLGVVSEADFMQRPELGTEPKRSWWLEWLTSEGAEADQYVHLHGRKVGEVMARNVVTTRKDAPLEEAVELMIKHRVKRLPVVDQGKLVGILTRSDLMRAMLKILSSEPRRVSDDERIRADIESELARRGWGGFIRAQVENGEVELTGTIFDDRSRSAARVAAENVPGVKSVREELIYIEPLSGMAILP